MSYLFKILDEHKLWLKSKGYDEEQLDNGYPPGRFMNSLHQLFSDCIQQSLLIKDEIDFQINTSGFFDNNRDLVLFTFHYNVKLSELELNLSKVDAFMSGITTEFIIKRDWKKELPSAKEIHLDLLNSKYRNILNRKETNISKRGRKL